ncbi:Uncharacterized protein Fot_29634 [Forsythia ovata]|uniref:EamA domain-containing protein n=1 Tax=Forsythia ovata TaxID=205694 RepID=A0ABD1TSV9_9LAMI
MAQTNAYKRVIPTLEIESFLSYVGVIFYGSSLLSDVLVTVSLPITESLAVLFFDEKFQPEKGVALFLSPWGFVFYFFSGRKQSKKNIHQTQEMEIVRADRQLRRDIQVTNSFFETWR